MPEVVTDRTSPQFDWLSEFRAVESLIAGGRAQEIGSRVREAAAKYVHSRYLHVLLGMICFRMNTPADAVRSFESAVGMTTDEPLPELNSPATQVYLESQLRMKPEDRSCLRRGRENFAKNIAAIRRVDAALAEELEGTAEDEVLGLIDLWGRLHFLHREHNQVVVLPSAFRESIGRVLGEYIPLALPTVGTGQELGYILDHQASFLLGRKRIIYLFEPELPRVRAQLHLRDFSEELARRELVILSGTNAGNRINEFFGTLRYPPPLAIVGEESRIRDHMERIHRILDPAEDRARAESYYKSEEFSRRLSDIAGGKILPRVLVSTCRWTTVLQYCAGDFRKSFDRLGCSTSFLIEEDDPQVITSALTWKTLAAFQPDFLFSISHIRASYDVPRELPVIGYVQDRCGPVLIRESLKDCIGPMDVCPCISHKFLDYLLGKGVPREQIEVMPVPADESKFYPLPADDPLRDRFTCDISYVKHGVADPDRMMTDWMASMNLSAGKVPAPVYDYFMSLYRRYRENPRLPWCEEEIFADARQQIGRFVPENRWNDIERILVGFQILVLGTCFRFYYLEALAASGLAMRLYGNQWGNDALFRRFAAGSVKGPELNAVYNFTRVNLHMNPGGTMHQRLCEGGLASGFFLASDCDPAVDWEPARNHFEPGKEIVLFDSPADLVDKCRYYLAHPKERADIAANMRARALKDHTCLQAARRILDLFQRRIDIYMAARGAHVMPSGRN